MYIIYYPTLALMTQLPPALSKAADRSDFLFSDPGRLDGPPPSSPRCRLGMTWDIFQPIAGWSISCKIPRNHG